MGGLGKFASGLVMLLGVVIIWVSSSEVVKFVYKKHQFEKPFFITYLNSSCFTLYLLGFVAKKNWRSEWTATFPSFRDVFTKQRPSTPPPGPHSGVNGEEAVPSKVSIYQMTRVAPVFMVLWFIANYAYSLSLDATSVSSNTILSSTSGFFTLVLGGVFPGTEADNFTIPKLIAVALNLGGVVLVSVSDAESSDSKDTALGDITALFSACMYAAYLVFLRRKTGDKEINMIQFLGMVGITNIFFMWPFFIILHFSGYEEFELPGDRVTWLLLFANALIGTVLSEVLWLWATLLTSPVISTLALSLTIPIAILADYIFKLDKTHLSAMYIGGTVLVIAAFFGVAYVSSSPEEREEMLAICCLKKKKPYIPLATQDDEDTSTHEEAATQGGTS